MIHFNHPFRYLLGILLILPLFTVGCTYDNEPEAIIQKTIETHGGDKLYNSNIAFTFRGDRFERSYQNGRFRYARTFTDTLGQTVYEAINNDSTWREIDGQPVSLSDSTKANIHESINSIIYFGFLPFKLDDEAVNERYIGTATINGSPYHEIEITFDKQGGGKDYQDRFVYWIHRNKYTIDYFAYHYHIDGGGVRFREAYNRRSINGIRFQNYRNYKPVSDSLLPEYKIERFDELLKNNQLKLVSRVAIDSVSVKLLEKQNNATN